MYRADNDNPKEDIGHLYSFLHQVKKVLVRTTCFIVIVTCHNRKISSYWEINALEVDSCLFKVSEKKLVFLNSYLPGINSEDVVQKYQLLGLIRDILIVF